MYAIVDPRARTINLYQLKVPGQYNVPHVFGEADAATFACLPTLSVLVAELFAGAPGTTL